MISAGSISSGVYSEMNAVMTKSTGMITITAEIVLTAFFISEVRNHPL